MPTEVGLGTATAAMPATARWQSGAGVFGALAFVADMPLGQAVYTAVPPGFGITTSEISI